MKGKLLFQEKQNFFKGQKFLLGTIIGISIGSVIFSMTKDTSPIALVGIIPPIIIIGLFGLINLHLKIDSKSIYLEYKPFTSGKTIDFSELEDFYVRKYNALLEYGGYGYRGFFSKSKAYNVSGKWGLQLIFKDGKKLLIGTKNQEELTKVVEKLKQQGGEAFNG